jgi:apolipoprotein N-acyltransferase
MIFSHTFIKQFFSNLTLVIIASILFALSFPNLLVENGIPLLAWIAYIPVFLIIYKSDIFACAFWGALYGYTSYSLFNYWLGVFHPLAGIIVGVIYTLYLGILFLFLKFALLIYPKKGYILHWILWLTYEYLRTFGFLGYSYGITAYSQWTVLPVIQIASLFGTLGVSALVVFPSAWLAAALKNFSFFSNVKTHNGKGRKTVYKPRFYQGVFACLRTELVNHFFMEKLSAIIWFICLLAALCYGFFFQGNYSNASTAVIALIQHNTNPWKSGLDEYRKDFYILRYLSDQALAAEPKPDMVVWPETAFVPRIYWHETYRGDPSSYILVKELLAYFAACNVPFLIGNNDARKDPSKNPNPDENYRVDYNAAILFTNGSMTQVYRKLHLVPFTEHFPYQKQFPRFYQWLKNSDTHFWEKGTENTIFQGPGFNFSSPICFEDSFPYISRNFVNKGAGLIVNITNDAWAKSLPSQNQHLSMSVFRAVENRRSLVRSAVSGQTCAIDPKGRIIAMAPPFSEAWITAEVPLVNEITLYTKYGDFPGKFFVILAFSLLILGGIRFIIKKTKKGN